MTRENETIRITVLAGEGTGLVEFNYKPHDLDFIWLLSGGARNPPAIRGSNLHALGTSIDSCSGR